MSALTDEERKWLTDLNEELWPPLTWEERRAGTGRINNSAMIMIGPIHALIQA